MNKNIPQLNNSRRTLESLREAMQPLRSVRAATSKALPNEMQFSSLPKPYGASTGELEIGGELTLNYEEAMITYLLGSKEEFTVELEGKNQITLSDEVLKKIGRYAPKAIFDTSKITDTRVFELEKGVAREYASMQNDMAKALEQVRRKLGEKAATVALWPHGFDLSLLWLKSEDGSVGMNFGFSPGIDDAQPYLYAFGWPTPNDLLDTTLPNHGKWETAWSSPGAKYEYSAIKEQGDQVEFATKLLLETHEIIEPMLEEKK